MQVIFLPGTNWKHLFYASSSYEDSDYVIFGAPFDKTCTFRKGTRYGPSGIRDAAATFEPYFFEYDLDLTDLKIHDAGDLDVGDLTPEEMVETVNDYSKKLVSDSKFPILMGGEHSVSPGSATAFNEIGVLGIDAHADYYDIYEESKNNHACAMRRMVDKFGEENVLWLGVRSIGKAEIEGSERIITSLEIFKHDIDWMIAEMDRLLPNRSIYLSLDIDGIDPAYAPGTGTPVPFGLRPIDVKRIINHLAPRLVGLDVVEVSPPLDNGITANLASFLIMEAILSIESAKKG